MTELPPLRIGRILRTLVEHRVDFVLIGGLAVIVHGVRRNTLDADIVIDEFDPENSARMADAYRELGWRSVREANFLDIDPSDAVDVARSFHFQVITDAGRLDVVRHHDWDSLVRTAIEVEVAGVQVRVVGRDELVAMKLAAGRPKDVQDVADINEQEREDK